MKNENSGLPAGLTLADLFKWSPMAQKVADAINAEKIALDETDKAHNTAVDATIAAEVRKYAEATEAEGVEPQVANAILRQNLTLAGIPSGTALNYGRAVEGFRKIKANGGDANKASVKDAQKAMRTDDQKAKDDIRDELRPMLRDATREQLQALLDYAKELNIVVKARKVRKDKGTGEDAGAGEDVAQQAAQA